MPNIRFGPHGKITLPTKYHGDVTLSKAKWETICGQPERNYYPFNGEKIATTLVSPDIVRHHKTESNQFFYYKNFPLIMIGEGISLSPFGGIYFAVIIDASTQRVCTCYPVSQPKTGKNFKSKEKP